MEHKVKVSILSDNRLFRELLARILSKKGDIEIVSTDQLSTDALKNLGNFLPEVLLVDSTAFVLSEAANLREHGSEDHKIKIVVAAVDEEEDADGALFLGAVRQGVSGFVPKEASALDVVAAVRSVARGEAVCPPRLCKFLFDFVAQQAQEQRGRRTTSSLGLTRRELQLIPMIDSGLTNKEIANKLNLSEQTVKNHVHRILHKVGVKNRLAIADVREAQELLQ